MEDIRIKVVYIRYTRYCEGPTVIGHVTAKSFREAIIKMLSKVGMYDDEDTILEREEELGREMTQDELINLLNGQNGDGCDFIVSLMNEDTGEEYLGADPGLEEWSI